MRKDRRRVFLNQGILGKQWKRMEGREGVRDLINYTPSQIHFKNEIFAIIEKIVLSWGLEIYSAFDFLFMSVFKPVITSVKGKHG